MRVAKEKKGIFRGQGAKSQHNGEQPREEDESQTDKGGSNHEGGKKRCEAESTKNDGNDVVEDKNERQAQFALVQEEQTQQEPAQYKRTTKNSGQLC